MRWAYGLMFMLPLGLAPDHQWPLMTNSFIKLLQVIFYSHKFHHLYHTCIYIEIFIRNSNNKNAFSSFCNKVQIYLQEMPTEEVNTNGEEEMMKIESSDKDDNSLTDHHDEALKMAQVFPPYVPKGKNGKCSNNYVSFFFKAECPGQHLM